MVRYSHIALLIPLTEPAGAEVSGHLGVSPTTVRESKGYRSDAAGVLQPHTSYTWMLDSKIDSSHEPIVRIHALLDEVEAFSDRLLSLDSKYQRWIDIVFHVTPQHPHGVTGEFDWLTLPHHTMGRMSRLQLMLAYEVFWFDHPDWQLPWYKKLVRMIRRQSPTRRQSQHARLSRLVLTHESRQPRVWLIFDVGRYPSLS